MGVPIYRGQGNAPFKTNEPVGAARRGQTSPYDVNGAPTGGSGGSVEVPYLSLDGGDAYSGGVPAYAIDGGSA